MLLKTLHKQDSSSSSSSSTRTSVLLFSYRHDRHYFHFIKFPAPNVFQPQIYKPYALLWADFTDSRRRSVFAFQPRLTLFWNSLCWLISTHTHTHFYANSFLNAIRTVQSLDSFIRSHFASNSLLFFSSQQHISQRNEWSAQVFRFLRNYCILPAQRGRAHAILRQHESHSPVTLKT